MRKLVTRRVIKDVIRHPNADSLDLVMVDGWQCISKKGEFKPGDPCIYIEVDAILPEGNPAWQHLVDKQGKHYARGKGARLRTIRLRGEYSQGLVLKTDSLQFDKTILDEDLDSQLGVYKYEAPETTIAGNAKGAFPNWFPKTDQERVENCFDVVASAGVESWIAEEKLEGSSITLYTDNGHFGVCSRNVDFKLDVSNASNVFVKTALESGYHAITKLKGRWAIQGELIGPGIQGNIYNLTKPSIYVFDVWDGEKQRYLTAHERMMFLESVRMATGIAIYEVPRLGVVILPETVEEVIASADGRSALFPTKREGVVFKSAHTVKNGLKEKIISFKAISRDYLVSEK